MKYLILSMTSTEEIRATLLEAVNKSGYNRKELAVKLRRKYPLYGWSERSLNYLLTDSQDISSAKANQIMEFIYPDEKFEFSLDNFQQIIDSMYERLSSLRREFAEAVRADKKIDDRDLNLLAAQTKVLSGLINRFEDAAIKAVNIKLA